jgi:SAM-dependent methyltransferase
MSRRRACVICDCGELETFLVVGQVPVHVGVLWEDAAAARACEKGPISLGVCRACGWIYNVDFDGSRIDYSQKYDNALHASSFFQEFESGLVKHLVTRYDLQGGTIAEIGCGSGHFLGLLTTAVDGRGIGFDPSHDPEYVDELASENVTFIRGEFPGTGKVPQVDLLACRQTLEHIPDPAGFLHRLRAALEDRNDTLLYFEVPNSTMPFRELSIWDLIYEHPLYFIAPTLRAVVERAGPGDETVGDLGHPVKGERISF